MNILKFIPGVAILLAFPLAGRGQSVQTVTLNQGAVVAVGDTLMLLKGGDMRGDFSFVTVMSSAAGASVPLKATWSRSRYVVEKIEREKRSGEYRLTGTVVGMPRNARDAVVANANRAFEAGELGR